MSMSLLVDEIAGKTFPLVGAATPHPVEWFL